MPRCIPSWTPFFNRFLVDFYSQLRPPESQKSSPRCSESTIFQKIALRNWHRFLIDFGANLAPFCLPKSSKILPKIDPKMHQIFDRFLHRFFLHFGSILEPKLGPCWPLFRHKTAPKTRPSAQDTQHAARTRFWSPRASILVPPGLDFGAPVH